MARKVAKVLVLQWNIYWVMKHNLEDVKHHFDKARFAKSLKTDSLHDAIKICQSRF